MRGKGWRKDKGVSPRRREGERGGGRGGERTRGSVQEGGRGR